MAKRFDYEALMSRNESTITTIVDGKSVTMSLKEWRKLHQPNRGKRNKKSNAEKANSVTAVEAEILKVERACKYLDSLKAWADNGYCRDYMSQIKAMSRKNDKDLFQILNWLCNHFEVVKTNLDTLMSNISTSGVLSAYRNEKCINEQGRRLGLRILVQRSTTAMGDIEGALNTIRTLICNGVDVAEYNLKGKRVA